MLQKPIYTEPENCQDCYKCVRECPVKAIRIENNKAAILEDRCIYCGHCTQICPTGAKKIRDGISRARIILENHPQVILSLAPSFINEFEAVTPAQLIAACRQLGFYGVSETALGAELVSEKVNSFLQTTSPGIYISSACPVVVEYIRKYSTGHLPAITPVLSPMLTHAKLLKKIYGNDFKIIFVGPCICKKLEADHFQDLVEVALTFRDLKNWMTQAGISPEKIHPGPADAFIPYSSGNGQLYPLEGGMAAGIPSDSHHIVKMAFSDMENIKNLLKKLPVGQEKDKLFLELLACKGGCINGPATLSRTSLAIKRYRILNRAQETIVASERHPENLDLSLHYTPDSMQCSQPHTEEEIRQALAAVGKTSEKDELNCSGCGYDSCRDFALAMLEDRAEGNMCVSYMRKVAHNKATVLLQKIPAGVLLVDGELRITDMNRYAACLLGGDTETIYEAVPGLQGVELDKVCSFSELFYNVLSSGKELTEHLIRENDKIWSLSIYNIQPHHLVFGLLQDLREPYVRKEWMVEKIQEVTQKHLSTVKQIACLLGENAAYSDAILRSVIEAVEATPFSNRNSGIPKTPELSQEPHER